MNIAKLIKTEDLKIFLLEERLNIINIEIEKIDNYLDKYGNYKLRKITRLNNKFNNLLNNQLIMKKELKQRRLYRIKLIEEENLINDEIIIED